MPMNKSIFKKEICSYCRYNDYCSKDKIEYGEIDKIVYTNEYRKELVREYTLEKKMKILHCDNYFKE